MYVILLDELDELVSSDLSFGEVLVEIGVELQYAGFGSAMVGLVGLKSFLGE